MRLAKPETMLISPSHLDVLLTILFIVGSITLCFWMLLPFLSVLAWAVTLTVLFLPMQMWLEKWCRYSSLSALLSTLIIGIVVVLPMVWATQQLSIQLYTSAQTIEKWIQTAPWQHAFSQKMIATYGANLQTYLDLPNLLKQFNGWLLGGSGSVVKYSANSLLHIGLIFYVLFFLLRDRQVAVKMLNTLSPLPERDLLNLLQQISFTIKAVVYGTLAIAAIQGFLGGLMFWWLGLPAPLLWGCVMALMSILPMLGAFLVWVPAAIYLLMTMQWLDALILSLWGLLIVGAIDNLLRPYWVSRELNMHPMQIFFSVIGGVVFFGPAGLILGPVTFSTTRFLLIHWKSQANLQANATSATIRDGKASE